MNGKPTNELEALLALEWWSGSSCCYDGIAFECCPVCEAIEPDSRKLHLQECGRNYKPSPTETVGGPAHEPECWLRERIESLR